MSIEAIVAIVLTGGSGVSGAVWILAKNAYNAYMLTRREQKEVEQNERDEILKRVGVLENDLGEAVARASAAEKRAVELGDEVNLLRGKVDQGDKTVGELLQSLNARDNRLKETNEQLEKLQASYEKLRIQLDSLTEEKIQLAKEKQQAESRADSAERELDRTRAKLEGVQETHAALLAAIRVEPPGEALADPTLHESTSDTHKPDNMAVASVPTPKRETGEIRIEGKK